MLKDLGLSKGVGGGVWHQVCILHLGVLNLGKWKLKRLSLCLAEAEWLLELVRFQLDFYFLSLPSLWWLLGNALQCVFAVILQAVLTYQSQLGLFIFGYFGDTRLWSSHNTQHMSQSTVLPADFSLWKSVLIDSMPHTGVVSHRNRTVLFHVAFHNCTLDGPRPRGTHGQVVRVVLFR